MYDHINEEKDERADEEAEEARLFLKVLAMDPYGDEEENEEHREKEEIEGVALGTDREFTGEDRIGNENAADDKEEDVGGGGGGGGGGGACSVTD